MSVAVAATGYFPSVVGLYATTVIMSIGFHYFETMNESLTLQFLPHSDTAHFMGRALAVKSVASLIAYGSIWVLMGQLDISYKTMYLIAGGLGVCITFLIWIVFPRFEPHTVQHKSSARGEDRSGRAAARRAPAAPSCCRDLHREPSLLRAVPQSVCLIRGRSVLIDASRAFFVFCLLWQLPAAHLRTWRLL